MSLKRSIRKKGSIEKKLIITQARKCILQSSRVRVTLAFICFGNFFLPPPPPPPPLIFYNNMNDTAKCSLGSYQTIGFIYLFNTFFVNQKLVCSHKLLWEGYRTSHDIGQFLGQSVRIVGPSSLRYKSAHEV